MGNWGVSIPITNDGACTLNYTVEYRKETDANYQILVPNPTASPAVIEGLEAATDYKVRITRNCCNGQLSASEIVSFTTGS